MIAAGKISRWVLTLVGVIGMGALSTAVDAATSEDSRIVNGLTTHGFPTTGALMYPSGGGAINENNAGSWCSGTLIGCQTFLTAAHCVEDDSNPARYWVFLQHGGIRSVTSIHSHPSYSSAGFPEHDVAVLKLGAPVTGITPTALNTVSSPGFGLSGQIAGFGQTSGSAGDYGIKRFGQIETRDCSGLFSGLGNQELVCWRFSSPVGAPGDDSNTSNGDSGGPLFLEIGGQEVVAGITSGGTSSSCEATDNSYDTNVYTYRSFIQGILGGDSTSACGGLSPVGSNDVDVFGFDGRLSSSNTRDTHTVSVPSGATELRVTLKGEDNSNPLNADLYVKQGATASPSSFDCKSDGSATVGECVFSSPAAGDWSLDVRRISGVGDYQVTATVFGGDPPVCGNGVREGNESCDGGDDSACPGACDGSCSCPAPVCGNGIVESGEVCDGASASACPTGTCSSSCQCPAPICGNDVAEDGESCDGSDDSLCPGQCQAGCNCVPVSCEPDLYVYKGVSNNKKFLWNGSIDNWFGTYDDLDPRDGLNLTVTQGNSQVSVSIPAGDSGWSRSRPSRGRYIWKGTRDGLKVIKMIRRDSRGEWLVRIKGRGVPGAASIDVVYEFADLELTLGSTCVSGVY